MVGQSRFDNRDQENIYITAQEASQYLGVKRATLYTYVSRGWIQTLRNGTRGSLYFKADVERLKVRQRARSGHGAVAGGALRWGEPVLETQISNIDAGNLSYRGRPAMDLLGIGFEQVAELLWSKSPGESPSAAPWPTQAPQRPPMDLLLRIAGEERSPLMMMSLLVSLLRVQDRSRFGATHTAELKRGRGLIRELATMMGVASDEAQRERARAEPTVARMIAVAAGRDPDTCGPALDAALIVCAEHGLNASTFAARVVAATGADLYACLQGGFGALSGPMHGGTCDRLEALLDEVGSPEHARTAVAARLGRGEGIAGFHHPLYPKGDPRTAPLIAQARRVGADLPRFQTAMAVAEVMEALGHPEPTVDFALVALTAALDLPRGASVGLFGVGRCAGWIAHILEQRRTQMLIRPRARYTGP